jgi:hypothetical protein
VAGSTDISTFFVLSVSVSTCSWSYKTFLYQFNKLFALSAENRLLIMDSRSSISLTLLSFAVLACCTLHAGAFSPTIHLGYASGARALRPNAASKDRFGVAGFAMSAHGAATKPGTGENRMTTTGFKVPLVEKVSVPSSQGYEWKVKADVLDAKKLNMQEKVKLAKPGLSIIDELEKLAAEAKEKGGAQVYHPFL